MASFEDLYAKLYQRNASMHQTFHNMNDAEQNARAQQTKAEREASDSFNAQQAKKQEAQSQDAYKRYQKQFEELLRKREHERAKEEETRAKRKAEYTEKWEAEWEAEWAKFEANRQRREGRTDEKGQWGGTFPQEGLCLSTPVYVQHDQDWEAFVKFADSVKPPERSIKLADIPLMQTHLLQAERQNDFFGPLVSLAERKAILKRLVVRWHPDRFMQKFGKKLVDEGQNTVLDRVTEMVQALNLRLNDLAELKY